MAYIKKVEEGAPAAQQVISGPADTTLAGASSTPTEQQAQQAVAPSATTMGTPSKSGMKFADIQRYIQTNRPQATQMAGKIGEYVQRRAQQDVGQAREQALAGFKSAISQASAPSVISPIRQAVETNVAQAASTPQGVEQIRSAMTQRFAGPATLSGEQLGSIRSAVAQATERAKLAGQEQGRKELIKTVVPGGRYTSGMAAFDAMLLQQSPEARQALLNIAQSVPAQYAGVEEAAKQETAQLGTKAAQEHEAARQQLSQRVQSMLEQQRALQRSAELSKEQELIARASALKPLLESPETIYQMTPEQRASIGMSEQQYQDLLNLADRAKTFGAGLNFRDLYSVLPEESIRSAVKSGALGSPEQRAKLAALENILGMASSLESPYVDPRLADVDIAGVLARSQADIEAMEADREARLEAHRRRQELIGAGTAAANRFILSLRDPESSLRRLLAQPEPEPEVMDG